MRTRFIIYSIMICCVTGCARQEYSKQKYWLDIQRPSIEKGKASDAIVKVETFSIDSAFRGTGIVYRKSEYEFESDYYRQYLIPPARMISEQTRKWLAESGLFAQVIAPGSSISHTHSLEGHVSELYLDSSVSNEQTVHVEVSFYLLSRQEDEDEVAFAKTCKAMESSASSSPEDYFKALETAMEKIFKEYENDLAKYLK